MYMGNNIPGEADFNSRPRMRANWSMMQAAGYLRYFNSRPRMRANVRQAHPFAQLSHINNTHPKRLAIIKNHEYC